MGPNIEQLLRCQHGAVSRAQLQGAGVNPNTIDTWLRRGRLQRILPAVYSVGPPSLGTQAHAAYLWQPRGVVSHLAAARLWQMAVEEPAVVHLTVPVGCARTSPAPWLRLLRRDTPRNRRSTVGGLPVTDVPRTVFDCLGLLGDAACAALLDHVTATLTSDRALRMRYLEEIGRRGSPRIGWQLTALVPGAASAPERLLAQGLHATGLTSFLINEPVPTAHEEHKEDLSYDEQQGHGDGSDQHGGCQVLDRRLVQCRGLNEYPVDRLSPDAVELGEGDHATDHAEGQIDDPEPEGDLDRPRPQPADRARGRRVVTGRWRRDRCHAGSR